MDFIRQWCKDHMSLELRGVLTHLMKVLVRRQRALGNGCEILKYSNGTWKRD